MTDILNCMRRHKSLTLIFLCLVIAGTPNALAETIPGAPTTLNGGFVLLGDTLLVGPITCVPAKTSIMPQTQLQFFQNGKWLFATKTISVRKARSCARGTPFGLFLKWEIDRLGQTIIEGQEGKLQLRVVSLPSLGNASMTNVPLSGNYFSMEVFADLNWLRFVVVPVACACPNPPEPDISQIFRYIELEVGSHGGVSQHLVTSYYGSLSAKYDFTPDVGFTVEDVLIDGVSIGSISSYIFYVHYEDTHSLAVTYVAVTENQGQLIVPEIDQSSVKDPNKDQEHCALPRICSH